MGNVYMYWVLVEATVQLFMQDSHNNFSNGSYGAVWSYSEPTKCNKLQHCSETQAITLHVNKDLRL